MRLAESEPLDLDATLGCGQAFRWRREGGRWEGVVDGRCIRLSQRGRLLHYSGSDEPFVRHYLALDLDLDRLLAAIDRDPVIEAAIDRSRGLRVLRQPLFECLLSFLCATNTNIPAVQSRVEAIADIWGEPAVGDENVRAFPSSTALRHATEDDFRACRLGYRAPYARSAVTAICSDPSWEGELSAVPHDEARARLMALPGIGPKAADCILLYALGHLDAFPIDVWIRRILARHYLPDLDTGTLSPSRYEAARNFGRDRFGAHAGYAQVYLFNARDLLCRD
ncbi:MAG: DNA glycosylase [Methanospirillum sp.]